jgi:hypothetical protein
MVIGGDPGKTWGQQARTTAPKLPEVVQKGVKSGHLSVPLSELLILGPWVRVPPGSPWEPWGFGRSRFLAAGPFPRSSPEIASGDHRPRRGTGAPGSARCAVVRTKKVVGAAAGQALVACVEGRLDHGNQSPFPCATFHAVTLKSRGTIQGCPHLETERRLAWPCPNAPYVDTCSSTARLCLIPKLRISTAGSNAPGTTMNRTQPRWLGPMPYSGPVSVTPAQAPR